MEGEGDGGPGWARRSVIGAVASLVVRVGSPSPVSIVWSNE